MLNDPITIPIAFIHGMLEGLNSRGETGAELLNQAGIAPELLLQSESRVPAANCVSLVNLLVEHLDDEAMGFLTRPLKLGSFSLMARFAQDAASLEQAIRDTAFTFRLLQDDLTLELMNEGEQTRVSLHVVDPARRQPIFLHEMLLRIFWRLFAWLIGGRLPVLRFDFALPAPPHAINYGKIFPAPLQFDQPCSAFWFDAAQLQQPIRRDDEALSSFLADSLSHLINPRINDDEISARVRRHLQHAQPIWPDLSSTANALHMSNATLQRRLANEGMSFQSLKDELRRDIAIVRLNTSTVQLAALAQELGFTDSAAFQRAFKTWTGSAPGAYRRGAA